MTIVAHAYQFVIGVDTHARTHALSILAAATGAVVDESQFPATEAGMARAIAWVGRRTDGEGRERAILHFRGRWTIG